MFKHNSYGQWRFSDVMRKLIGSVSLAVRTITYRSVGVSDTEQVMVGVDSVRFTVVPAADAVILVILRPNPVVGCCPRLTANTLEVEKSTGMSGGRVARLA